MPAEIPDGAVIMARAILNSSLWTMRPEDRVVAMTCIALCNWRPRKWWDGRAEVVIGRGQFVASWDRLAKAAGLKTKVVRTSVQNLCNIGFLARHQARRYSIYTLPKYDHYQDITKYSDSAVVGAGKTSGSERAANGQRAGNKQEGKEGEEGNKKTIPLASPTPSDQPLLEQADRRVEALGKALQIVKTVEPEPVRVVLHEFLGWLESRPEIPGKRVHETIFKLANLRQSLIADNGIPRDKIFVYALRETMKHDSFSASYVAKVMQNAVMKWREGIFRG